MVVVELENTLLQVVKSGSATKLFGSSSGVRNPDFSKEGYNVHYRRGREEFLDTLLNKHKDKAYVGVWTSLDRNVGLLAARAYFGPYFDKLFFLNTTQRTAVKGPSTETTGAFPIQKVEQDLQGT